MTRRSCRCRPTRNPTWYSARNPDELATWKHLLTVLPKDSDVIQSVQGQITNTEAERDGRAPPAEAATTSNETDEATTPVTAPPPTAAADPHLTVKVALDPMLKDKTAPTDVLFVYAKAASGPPMPLAIQRMQASQLPATVTLTGIPSCSVASGAAVCANPGVSGNDVSGTVPTFPANSSVTITITGTATNGQDVSNTATVAPPSGVTDPNLNDNSSTVSGSAMPVKLQNFDVK